MVRGLEEKKKLLIVPSKLTDLSSKARHAIWLHVWSGEIPINLIQPGFAMNPWLWQT